MQLFVRYLLISGGTISVALAVAGIILPVLPTTPFLLLAAFCYARSSRRFHDWLTQHRWFGPYLAAYRSGRGLSRRQLAGTLLPLWISIAIGALIVPLWWQRVVLLCCAAGVTIYLVSRRSSALARRDRVQTRGSEAERG